MFGTKRTRPPANAGGDDDAGVRAGVSMLAKEMSDTSNRAGSSGVRDLASGPARGRLEAAGTARCAHPAVWRRHGGAAALLLAIARKLKFPLTAGDLPPFADGQLLGGNELEGVLVRALRLHELSEEPRRPIREILADVLKEVRPSPHTRKLEYMDLVAVKECTDARFAERYRE